MKKTVFISCFLISFLLLSACGKEKREDQENTGSQLLEESVAAPVSDAAENEELPAESAEIPYPLPEMAVRYTHPADYESLYLLQSSQLENKRVSEASLCYEDHNDSAGAAAEFLLGSSYSFRCADESWTAFSSRVVRFKDYLYALSGSDMIVLSSDESSDKLNSITASDETEEGWYGSDTPRALWIDGETLFIMTEKMLSSEDGRLRDSVTLKSYSLSDPTEPLLKNAVSFNGNLIGSCRNDGGILLAVFFPVEEINENDTESYVPFISENGEDRLLQPDEIAIPSVSSSSGYTVLAYIPFEDPSDILCEAVGAFLPYGILSGNDLYLAGSGLQLAESDPYLEYPYTVTAYSCSEVTQILAIDTESFSLSGNTILPGKLSSTFSFDLIDGKPVAGLTEESQRFRCFLDETYHFENYLADGIIRSSSVFRFSEDLSEKESLDAGDCSSIHISAGNAWIFEDSSAFFPGSCVPLNLPSLQIEDCKSLTSLPLKVLRENSSGMICSAISYVSDGDYYDYALELLELPDLNPRSELIGIDPSRIIFAEDNSAMILQVNGINCLYDLNDGSFVYLGDLSVSYLDEKSTALFKTEEGWSLCNDSALYSYDNELEPIEIIPFAFG